jgi:hypothetical protein
MEVSHELVGFTSLENHVVYFLSIENYNIRNCNVDREERQRDFEEVNIFTV